MNIKIIGVNFDIGQSLQEYAKENLIKISNKYFADAISGDVRFTKNSHLFSATIIVNEGVNGRNLIAKGEAQSGDAFAAYNEALERISKQMRRYKERIKDYRYQRTIKDLSPKIDLVSATKYVMPPVNYNIFEEFEEGEDANKPSQNLPKVEIISQKDADIETLSVEEAVMKMDLQSLPALVFINSTTNKINFVYQRKDGNISWIDIKN
jgi:ribosomal subunit interface protein